MPTEPESGSISAGDPRQSATVTYLNDYIQNITRNLEFTVDEEVNRVIVKVYNLETAEVVRQIPAEEALIMTVVSRRRRA